MIVAIVSAQNTKGDSLTRSSIIVNKDPRMAILERKQLEFNTINLKSSKGFRLLVISSNDREKVMNLRAKLLQLYPEQKVYMIFQNPFIKLKFGNFVDKEEAERYRDLLTDSKLVSNNIYVLPETVVVKADKIKEEE